MQELSLSFCELKTIPDLRNHDIIVLNISDNNLTEICAANLPLTLKKLDVGNNDSIKILPNLSGFALEELELLNDIGILDFSNLKYITTLKTLSLPDSFHD